MTQFTEIKEAINPAQQVIARNVISEVESVEELILGTSQKTENKAR